MFSCFEIQFEFTIKYRKFYRVFEEQSILSGSIKILHIWPSIGINFATLPTRAAELVSWALADDETKSSTVCQSQWKKKIVIMKCRGFALIVCWTGNSTSRNKYILWIDADGISENFSESLAVIKWIWLVLWKKFMHWLELEEPKYRWRKNKRMLWWVSSLNNLQTNLLHESLCTSFDVAII